MNHKKIFAPLFLAVLLAGVVNTSQAAVSGMKITEWMYNPVGSPGEFIEFTNLGTSAVSFAGWSFDDSSNTPGSEDLSSFGFITAGESVIITEATADAFRTAWNLDPAIKIIGGITNNLGRADAINLYDSTGLLVDKLVYNDQGAGTVKGPRTQGVSAEAGSISDLGTNNASLWVLAVVGDKEGSYMSIGGDIGGGDIGSPGMTSFAAVAAIPEPETYVMLLAGLGLLGFTARRRKIDQVSGNQELPKTE